MIHAPPRLARVQNEEVANTIAAPGTGAVAGEYESYLVGPAVPGALPPAVAQHISELAADPQSGVQWVLEEQFLCGFGTRGAFTFRSAEHKARFFAGNKIVKAELSRDAFVGMLSSGGFLWSRGVCFWDCVAANWVC